MPKFDIFPAIDLQHGVVVRLSQGNPTAQTKYSEAPEQVVENWAAQGARWLHIVNLDGAFGKTTSGNQAAIETVLQAAEKHIRVQLGGGLRSTRQITAALSAGVDRVVLGTAAIEEPDFGLAALAKFGPDQIIFGFDALNGHLMVRGWKKRALFTTQALAKTFSQAGAKTVVYTNIRRDGMQTGVDWEHAQVLAEETGLNVIASGGTASLADISKVYKAGLSGIIIGRALYEGNFTLKEALSVG